MTLEDYITRVPVYVELDRPEELAFAIQAICRQILNIKDVIRAGGGGGATTLASLLDVTITEPKEGQILKYTNDSWVNVDDSGEQPGPNTVGTEQIVDDSIIMDDLNQSVKDEMITKDNRVTTEELEKFKV